MACADPSDPALAPVSGALTLRPVHVNGAGRPRWSILASGRWDKQTVLAARRRSTRSR